MQANEYDDAVRVVSYKEGELSFSALYETHFQRLFEYGCRLHADQYLVQDCIQDTFIKLWHNRDRIPEINNIKSYLLIALKNNILNKIASARSNAEVKEDNLFELTYSIEEEIVKRETSAKTLTELYAALNALTSRQKECLYLRYFEGLSYDEIAALLNISTKATYKLTARALEYLKNNLSEPLLLFYFLGIIKNG